MRKTIIYSSSEKCMYCGNDIPEGRMICPVCEAKMLNMEAEKKKLNKTFPGCGMLKRIFV